MARVTQAHVEARRSQILDAAWECFARRGYHQTTMQDIAAAAELSAGALYLYFDGKEAVLKAMHDRSLEMGRALVAEARSHLGGPLDALAAIGQTMLSVFNDPTFETTARVNIEILPEVLRNEELRTNFGKELAFWRGAVTQLLREAQERGQLREGIDPASLATLSICAWEGLRNYRLLDPDNFQPQLLVDLMRAFLSEEQAAAAITFEPELTGREPPLGPPFGSAHRPGDERAAD